MKRQFEINDHVWVKRTKRTAVVVNWEIIGSSVKYYVEFVYGNTRRSRSLHVFALWDTEIEADCEIPL